jgi:hypothetical protein
MSILTKNEVKRALQSILLSLKDKGINYEMVHANVVSDTKDSGISSEWVFEEEKLEDIKQTYSSKPNIMKGLFMPIVLNKRSVLVCYTWNNKMYLTHSLIQAVSSHIEDKNDIYDIQDCIEDFEYYSNSFNCNCNRVHDTIIFNYILCLSNFEVNELTDEIKEFIQNWILDGMEVFTELLCDIEDVDSPDELSNHDFDEFIPNMEQ